MPIYGRFWGRPNNSDSSLPQLRTSDVPAEESICAGWDDDYEFIDEEDLEGYTPGTTPDQGSSTRTYSRLPSWSRFTKRGGTPVVHQSETAEAEIAQTGAGPNVEPPVVHQEELSMSTQVEHVNAAPTTEDQTAHEMLEDLRDEHDAAMKEFSSKIDKINLQLDGQTSAFIHMQKYQQAYTRDIRELQRQIAKVNIPAEWQETLYGVVKSQIQMLHFEVEKKVIEDFERSLDEQIAAYRKAYNSEIAELREILALQADELRSLRDRLNQIENGPGYPATRAGRSSDRGLQHDFPFCTTYVTRNITDSNKVL